MKGIAIVAVSVLMVAILVLGISTAMAAKPQQVIEWSNGFPSGAHFNLNIHGKNDNFICDPTPGGGSVFVDEYGPATIQYVSNKKSSVTELKVLDPCAVDGGTAKVQLPREELGYYVFARILGKPNNADDGDPSSIILDPNVVVQACNDTDPANPDFPDYTECPDDPLLALGLIVGPNLYVIDPETGTYVRFDPESTTKQGKGQAKGKSKATDITPLFTYTGWVYDASLDTSGPDGVPDGVIDNYDVPLDPWDANEDGIIDQAEFEAWRNAMVLAGLAWEFVDEWIFNIADLVVTEQGLENDGTKLLQVRFYPVATTEFTPQ